jgi:hypothetical protein
MTGTALTLATREVNAPRPEPIDEATLIACLRSRSIDRRWTPHVRAFLEELPVEMIHDVVLEKHVTFRELKSAAEIWGKLDGENIAWIEEMAAHRMA